MATLQTQSVTLNGIAPTYAAATGGGDEFSVDGRTLLHVKNGSGSPITVTVVTPGTAFGQSIADVAVSVPAAGERMIGGFDPEGFRGSDGLASVTYSGVTSLTIAVLRV